MGCPSVCCCASAGASSLLQQQLNLTQGNLGSATLSLCVPRLLLRRLSTTTHPACPTRFQPPARTNLTHNDGPTQPLKQSQEHTPSPTHSPNTWPPIPLAPPPPTHTHSQVLRVSIHTPPAPAYDIHTKLHTDMGRDTLPSNPTNPTTFFTAAFISATRCLDIHARAQQNSATRGHSQDIREIAQPEHMHQTPHTHQFTCAVQASLTQTEGTHRKER